MSTITQEQLVKVTNILEQLDEHPLPDRSTNRRHSCRTTIRTSLKVLLLQGGTPAPVDIFSRNISLSGMGFVCRRMFKPDERLAISLLIPKLPPSSSWRASPSAATSATASTKWALSSSSALTIPLANPAFPSAGWSPPAA